MKITKTAILSQLTLDKMWHTRAWKIIDTDDFDQITNRDDKRHIIAEFRQQKELAEYIYREVKS